MASDCSVPAVPGFSTEQELEHLLLEGLYSGEPIEATAEFWESIRHEARVKFELNQAELRKAS